MRKSSRSVRGCLTASALAWAFWGSTSAQAQQRRDEHHWEEHGHPGASVRYGGGQPYRTVAPGSVRYEHYHENEHERERFGRPIFAGPVAGIGYRNPYQAGYFRGTRPGYWPIVLNGAQYNAYASLPFGYQSVVVNGANYYLADGMYYQPYLYQGQTIYLVVSPPIP